ncbi:MAG: heme exporter protein CcmD [Caldimonas sp.]
MIVWNDWSAFVAMGGYGSYVWGSFAMAGAAMALEVGALRARRRALRPKDVGAVRARTSGEAPRPYSRGAA